MSRFIFVSHTPDGGVFKVGSHHLARELSVSGHDVVHASVPQSSLHKVFGANASRAELSSRSPWVDDWGTLHIVASTVLPAQAGGVHEFYSSIQRTAHGKYDAAFVDEPLLVRRKNLQELARLVVYRPTDVYQRGLRERRQRKIVRFADGVVATSNVVANELHAPSDMPLLVLPNGVDIARFSEHRSTAARSGVVYVGALDQRFDWNLLDRLGSDLPEVNFDIFGPTPSTVPLLPGNVRLRGPVEYDSLPAVLSRYKVGIMPFNVDMQLNQGRSPMKLFEFLGAELWVLQPSYGRLIDLPGVSGYDSPQDARTMLHTLLRRPQPNTAGSLAAASQDWSLKSQELTHFTLKLAVAQAKRTT